MIYNLCSFKIYVYFKFGVLEPKPETKDNCIPIVYSDM